MWLFYRDKINTSHPSNLLRLLDGPLGGRSLVSLSSRDSKLRRHHFRLQMTFNMQRCGSLPRAHFHFEPPTGRGKKCGRPRQPTFAPARRFDVKAQVVLALQRGNTSDEGQGSHFLACFQQWSSAAATAALLPSLGSGGRSTASEWNVPSWFKVQLSGEAP